jgi:hypothetical protein
MLDAVLSVIHTQFILTGAGGGFLHILHERKLDPGEAARYILAAILLSNFVGPLVLVFVPSIPAGAAEGVGFVLGYGVSRICRFLDRYLDKELKPYEGPEHE